MSTKKVTEKDIIKNLIKESVPTVQELSYTTENGELKVKVYPVIPYVKRTQMVRDIVEGVFMGEKDSLDCYMPEFLSLVKRHATLTYFTDVKLPTKLEDMWLMLRYTPIYDDVVKIVEKDLDEIFEAAEDSIKAYKKRLIKKTDFSGFINKISQHAQDFAKNMPEMNLENFDMGKVNEILKEKGVNVDLNGILGSILKQPEATADNK